MMDDRYLRLLVQDTVRPKFHGHDRLYGKAQPNYPVSVEREYERLMRAYMKALSDSVKEHLLELTSQHRTDADGDMQGVDGVFERILAAFKEKASKLDLKKRLESIGEMTRKLSTRQWKRMIKRTLGIDLYEDYYLGDFYRANMSQWVNDNVALITTIQQETLGDMKQAVQEAFEQGQQGRDVVKVIQKRYNVSQNHAIFWARDQAAKLNADITRAQQVDAGVYRYRWSTTGDGRVRKAHRELNNKVFSWDNPPVVDTETGRRAHPGQDYNCRCVAIPVFEINTLSLPVAA